MLLFVLCLVCYLANGRTLPVQLGGDTIPNRLLPFSILRYGTLTLDPFRKDFEATGRIPWYVKERQGHLVSVYPIGSAVLALPVYAPMYLWLAATGEVSSARLFAASEKAEKIAASTLAAAAVAVFYLMLRRRVGTATAFWAAVAFGLGSSLWATASQLLWQHGPVVLVLTAALWLLLWPERPSWSLAAAGFLLGLAVLIRPTAGLFWLAGCGCTLVGGGTLSERLRRTVLFLAAGLPLIALTLGYNWMYYRTPLGGYGLATHFFSQARPLVGTAGLLISPNRGLLVFTPIALLGLLGIARALARPAREPVVAIFALAALCHLALMGSYGDWTGGWSFGPRYLVDVLPILGLAGAQMWPGLSRLGKGLTWAGLVWSILVQLNGAFCYPASRWNARMGEQIAQEAWNPRHFELWEDFQAWREMEGLVAPW